MKIEIKKMETFTIGQLDRKANVNLETIRFYERRGLLANVLYWKNSTKQIRRKGGDKIRAQNA